MQEPLIGKDETVFKGKFLHVVRRHFRTRSGKSNAWELVRRKTYGPVVAIIPVTPYGEVILTKTFRIPHKSYVIELPAGLMDKKGESPSRTARRELLEETGYAARAMKKILVGPIDVALSQEKIVIYLAEGAKKIRTPQRDDSEYMEVQRIPLKNLSAFLARESKHTLIDLKVRMLPLLLRAMRLKRRS